MPSFDAASVVEPLDYDFTKFGGEKGVVPEPTPEVLAEFLRSVTELIPDIAKLKFELPENATEEQTIEAMQKLTTSQILVETFERLTELYSNVLCQGTPSVAQLQKLPMRIRQAFFNWLTEECRPEIFGAATTSRRPDLRVVGAG